MKSFRPLFFIRYSLVFLFAWFGFQQLLHPEAWVVFLPEWTGYFPIPGEMLVQLNGWFELVFATALLIGVYTRFVAALLGLHLLGIAWTAGGAIGVRDAVLGLCTLSLAFGQPDEGTVDHCVREKSEKS